jgi:hypothetical protein
MIQFAARIAGRVALRAHGDFFHEVPPPFDLGVVGRSRARLRLCDRRETYHQDGCRKKDASKHCVALSFPGNRALSNSKDDLTGAQGHYMVRESGR